MFERYTEKARRVIFFARYEASQYGSPEIDSEHLLLGLLRESKSLWQWIPKARPDELHQLIDARIPKQPRISTAIDLPLSDAGKVILKAAARRSRSTQPSQYRDRAHLSRAICSRRLPR